MNDKRRRRVRLALNWIEVPDLQIGQAEKMINDILDEENESLSNLPENLEESISAEEMQDAIETLEIAADHLNSARDYIYKATKELISIVE